jgi:hypothetical protein
MNYGIYYDIPPQIANTEKASLASLLIIQESLLSIKDLLNQQKSIASELVVEIEQIDDLLSASFTKWKSELERDEEIAIEKTREMEEFYKREMKVIEQTYQKSLKDDQKYIVSRDLFT